MKFAPRFFFASPSRSFETPLVSPNSPTPNMKTRLQNPKEPASDTNILSFSQPRSDLPGPPSVPSRVPSLALNRSSQEPYRDSQRMVSPPRSPKSPKSAGGLSIVSIQTSMVEGCEINGAHMERGLDEVEEVMSTAEQGSASERKTEKRSFKSVESAMAYKRRADTVRSCLKPHALHTPTPYTKMISRPCALLHPTPK